MKIHARTTLAGFLLIATVFLWKEHWSHFLGALPWALLLLCPILYLSIHRGHGGRESRGSREALHGSNRMDPGEGGE